MCFLTLVSSDASISSASSSSWTASGTTVEQPPSAASSRPHASQSSSTLARRRSASAERRLSFSRASAKRILLLDILSEAAGLGSSCLSVSFDLAISCASLSSMDNKKPANVSFCQERLTTASTRRAQGPHRGPAGSLPSSCCSCSGLAVAISTCSSAGQSMSAPGSSSRSAARRRAWLSGAPSTSASPARSRMSRRGAALPQASTKTSRALLRRRAW
mmetsp:Transcript_27669/g.79767  ORF Transcript_27669/g.79767 Transcript_27669/m.79767 type:complete len:218 (-) Transcript_27669:31-684(-)